MGTKTNQTLNQTLQAMPQLSHQSAQQLLSAGNCSGHVITLLIMTVITGNILFCTNSGQLTLPSAQSSQSSTSSPTLMYNPTQGVVYATAGGASANGLLTDGLILNLGQNQSNGTEFLLNQNVFSQVLLGFRVILIRPIISLNINWSKIISFKLNFRWIVFRLNEFRWKLFVYLS